MATSVSAFTGLPEPGGPDAAQLQALIGQLRESEERFRTMADCSPVLLWMAGTDALCTFFNKGWLEFTGRTLDEEYGNGWAEGVHPEDFQRCMQHYMDSFVARRPFRMEYRLRRADGAYRWLLDTGVPRNTPGGSFAGYIGSCIDITELREAHQHLRRMNEELERRVQERTEALRHSIAELEQYAYVTSHDLRAPLRTISGFVGLLQKRHAGKLNGEALEFLDFIAGGARRMQHLLDDLLAYSRVGREPSACGAVDLNAVLADVLQDLDAGIRERNARIELAPLPTVAGDRTLLGIVFQNLLQNGIKFCRDLRQHVRVGAAREGEGWRIFVSDNGIGIPADCRERIFGVFSRLHAEEEFPGNGIGLAICRKAIDRLGGRIWVDSEPGAGATFHVSLPAADADADGGAQR
jgi:PAS domain S-box-containing protein